MNLKISTVFINFFHNIPHHFRSINSKISKMTDETKTENYFDSYDNISVHNLMLRDFPRVSKYREAIMASKETFRDKVNTIKNSII